MALRTCNTSTVLVSNLNEVVKDSASKFGSHCRFCCFFFPSSYWPWISICKMLAKSLLHSSRKLFIIFIFLCCSQKMLRTQCREQTGEHRRGLYITVTPPSIHTPHSFCISVPCLLGKKKKKILKKKKKLLIGKWASLTSLACAYVISLCKSPCEWPFPWLNCHC